MSHWRSISRIGRRRLDSKKFQTQSKVIERCFSENVVALTIGLEDYTADLGVAKTPEGRESQYARTRLVNAARAAGVQAIDSVASHASWMENFPWTRLANASMPSRQKPMSDLEHLRQLDPQSLRAYLGDGNYGGHYQHDDEEMLKIWQVAVVETRALRSVGSN